jgi:hypothetical protein
MRKIYFDKLGNIKQPKNYFIILIRILSVVGIAFLARQYYNDWIRTKRLKEVLEKGLIKGTKINADIFPNPTTGIITINVESTDKELICSIFNIQTVLLLQYNIKTPSSIFDLSFLEEGKYKVVITNKDRKNAAVFELEKVAEKEDEEMREK